MDSITQATLGASVGELVLGRRLGWAGAAWGLFFGTLPDLDVVFMPFMDEAQKLYWHRGISHSVLLMVVGTLIFAPLLASMWKRQGKDVSLNRAAVFVFLAWSTHVLIDCFTTYGTSLWEPFSDDRVWWNVMFIIDPLFTLSMFAGLVMSVFLWRKRPKRWLPTALGVGLSLCYVGFSICMKSFLIHPHFSEVMQKEDAKLLALSPLPLNTILWRGIGETEDEYLIGLYSPLDTDGEIQLQRVKKNQHLLEGMMDSREFKAVDWFSRGIWSAETGANGRVRMVDRRFSEMMIPEGERRRSVPVFVWEFWKEKDGVEFQQVRLGERKIKIKQQLGDLWNRILGMETH